ncbi:hypothetical protein [Erwinia billingiae]|uniref:hypothetical protein n=1 Tax=Erwinia billingiae TaxID=182337 RepID=UPI002246B129|nr:hypothetical protein [Erwinia billingiae]MCX0499716.1 hypothetical protein [Erwinia billingiae]
MGKLEAVVELYRVSGKPDYDGMGFSATVLFTPTISTLISDLANNKNPYGGFDILEIDGDEWTEGEPFPSSGSEIYFSFSTYNRSSDKFYKGKSEFLNANTLKKGVIPSEYYIVEDDFISNSPVIPEYIVKANKLCEFIISLSKLAHYHDTRSELTNYKLIFVKNSDSKSSSISLETDFSEELIQNQLNTGVINYLSDEKNKFKPHFNESLGIFRNSLVDYVTEQGKGFNDLVTSWADFHDYYEKNLSVYLSGFSFHKARKDVASAETEFAEKTSKIISELTIKLLSIPLSFIASLGIAKLDKGLDISIAFIGVVITSVILLMVIKNQENQFKRIIHAKNLVFEPFQKDKDTYPPPLQKEITEVLKELKGNEVTASRTLDAFKALTFTPVIVAIFSILFKVF